jgi:hypothetical protein
MNTLQTARAGGANTSGGDPPFENLAQCAIIRCANEPYPTGDIVNGSGTRGDASVSTLIVRSKRRDQASDTPCRPCD